MKAAKILTQVIHSESFNSFYEIHATPLIGIHCWNQIYAR